MWTVIDPMSTEKDWPCFAAGPGIAAAFIAHNYNTNSSILPQTYPYGPTADGKLHGVWFTALPANKDICPIPQPQIGLNPNLKQNPGY